MARADTKYVRFVVRKLPDSNDFQTPVSDTGAFVVGNHLIVTDTDGGVGSQWRQATIWEAVSNTGGELVTDPLKNFPADEVSVVTLNSDDHGKAFKLGAATTKGDVLTTFEVNPDGALLGLLTDRFRLTQVRFDADASAGLAEARLAPEIIDVIVAHKAWSIEFRSTSAKVILEKDGNRIEIRTRYVPTVAPIHKVYCTEYDIDGCVRLNLTGKALKSALKNLGVSGAKRSNDVVVLTQDGRLFNAETESSVTLSEDVRADERVHFTMPVSAQLVVAIARNVGARDTIEFAWGHNGQLSAQQQRRPISYRVNSDHEGLLMPRRSDFVVPEPAQARA